MDKYEKQKRNYEVTCVFDESKEFIEDKLLEVFDIYLENNIYGEE